MHSPLNRLSENISFIFLRIAPIARLRVKRKFLSHLSPTSADTKICNPMGSSAGSSTWGLLYFVVAFGFVTLRFLWSWQYGPHLPFVNQGIKEDTILCLRCQKQYLVGGVQLNLYLSLENKQSLLLKDRNTFLA